MFVSSNGLVEALTVSESAEMERASPTIFVEICGEIIIMPGKSGILCFPRLIDLLAKNRDHSRSDQRSLL